MSHLNTAYKLGALTATQDFQKQSLAAALPMPPTTAQRLSQPQAGAAGINPAILRQFGGSNAPGTPQGPGTNTGGPSAMTGQRPQNFGKTMNTGLKAPQVAPFGQTQQHPVGAAVGSNPWTSPAINSRST